MHSWNPSVQYQKVAEANRRYYAKTAHLYDATETCVTNVTIQQQLEQDLDTVLALIGKPPQAIRALDACGGSGNISLKLLRRGVPTVTCDISIDLLRILQTRGETEGLTPQIVCSEIAVFLLGQPARFDLIVFSSALHHLEDIEGVLRLAIRSLAPGGVIFTTFDPIMHRHRYAPTILWLDYLAFKVLSQPSDVWAACLRRTRRILGRVVSKEQAALVEENLGFLAEYHVEQGIDDLALASRLCAEGVEVVRHDRETGARYRLTRALLRALGVATTFKLVLRKVSR